MLKDLKRWMLIRDGKSPPETEEELVELVRFEVRNHCAWEEQAYAQRRVPKPEEMQARALTNARKIIKLVNDYNERDPRPLAMRSETPISDLAKKSHEAFDNDPIILDD